MIVTEITPVINTIKNNEDRTHANHKGNNKREIYGVGRSCGPHIASTKVLRTTMGAANLREGKRGSGSSHGRLHEGF